MFVLTFVGQPCAVPDASDSTPPIDLSHMQSACRHAHEEGDHAEAILLCVDCFHAVETLSMCKVCATKAKVQLTFCLGIQ